MTDQGKIPLPSEKVPESEAGSLIERAVKAFDLGRLAPPPVPEQFASAPRRPLCKDAAPALQPAAMAEPPIVQPLAEKAETAAAEAPVSAPQSAEPVRFSETRHPIDRALLREQAMIVPEGSVTGLLEEFRIIKRQILQQAADLRRQGGGGAAQRVLVCSPHPGEGKTYCSVNLALSIAAEKEGEVVLFDADFAKPSVLRVLGLPGGPGLMDALSDPSADISDFVLGTDVPGLWVLPAGDATNTDTENMNTSRTAGVLDRLTAGAPRRTVIFDSPPALAASPAAELAKYVGQVLMVVRAGTTGQGSIEDAASLLSACPNIQLLLNATQFSPSGRTFGSYYGYGS